MNDTEETLKQKYIDNLPLFNRSCKNVVDALTIFLTERQIPFLTISSRIKEFESFFEKSEKKNYNEPFIDNEDFCGVRIIVYYVTDIERVKEIIAKEFNIQKNDNKSQQLELNEFGYRSHHFIVKIKEEWLSSPNYRGLKDVKIEIQVRTVLMHAWAEIEHKLGYKNKEQVPNELQRKLFIISAKLEEADGQFQDLKLNIESYKTQLLTESTKLGRFTSQEFNLNTLQSLLDFYFPEHERDNYYPPSDLFQKIKKYNLSLDDIVSYAEKLKPHVKMIDEALYGNKTDRKTYQTNLMAYAIEAFYPKVDTKNATGSRKKLIQLVKDVAK